MMVVVVGSRQFWNSLSSALQLGTPSFPFVRVRLTAMAHEGGPARASGRQEPEETGPPSASVQSARTPRRTIRVQDEAAVTQQAKGRPTSSAR